MWFFLIFESYSPHKPPLFYERDESFHAEFMKVMNERRLQRKAAQRSESISSDCSYSELDHIWKMFSHLVLAHSKLTANFSRPEAIITENGFKILMKRPMEDVLFMVGIGGKDEGSSILQLERRMDAANSILKFTYGQSYNAWLRSRTQKERNDLEWPKISLLINTWLKLYESEQSYLAEAIEEIESIGRADDPNSIGAHCEALFKEAVDTVRNKLGGRHYQQKPVHTILTVDSKVVRMKSSNRNAVLSPHDVLLAMVISKAFFPNVIKPEDLFSQTYKQETEQEVITDHEPLSYEHQSKHSDTDYENAPDENVDMDLMAAKDVLKDSDASSPDFYVSMDFEPFSRQSLSFDEKDESFYPDGDDALNRPHENNTTPVNVDGQLKPLPRPSSKLSVANRRSLRRVKSLENLPQSLSPAVNRRKKSGSTYHRGSVTSDDEKKPRNRAVTSVTQQQVESPPLLRPLSRTQRPYYDSISSFTTCTGPQMNVTLDPLELLEQVLEYSDKAHFKKDFFVHMRVFIRTTEVDYMPACLYVLHIANTINLIIIAEITDPARVTRVLEPIKMLYQLLPFPENTGGLPPSKIINRIAEKLQKIVALGDQCFVEPTRSKFKDQVNKVLSEWLKEVDSLHKAVTSMTSTSGKMRSLVEDMESFIISVIVNLKAIFTYIFMKIIDLQKESADAMEKLRLCGQSHLKYHLMILAVKSKRNMAISKYQTIRFPGLVHFIYINRYNNTIKTPSLELASDDTSLSAQVIRYMRKILWRVLPWIYRQLAKGMTTIRIKEGDFMFTYELFLYSEINVRCLSFPQEFDSIRQQNPRPIGNFTGRFYRTLLSLLPTSSRPGVRPLELLTVHLAVTNSSSIDIQRRMLRNELHVFENIFN